MISPSVGFDALFAALPGCYAMLTPALQLTRVNGAFAEAFGVDRASLVGRDLVELLLGTSSREREGEAMNDGRVAALRDSVTDVVVLRRPQLLAQLQGIDTSWQLTLTPLDETDDATRGPAPLVLLHLVDVTAQKDEQDRWRAVFEERMAEHSRARTRADEQRRAAEEALVHSQKLEAVGHLTGGVAHDFNNVLQIIGSNLQLLAPALVPGSDAARRLESALGGVARGAKLASQLLAFARRQPLQPDVVSLDALVGRMDDLLRRSLGERIAVRTLLGKALWNVSVDPHHLENVLVNLAINARDAMEHRGNLTIVIENAALDEAYAARHLDVRPGDYVLLGVTDDGCGMSKAVIERAFEPFFTTKPEGHGTGLGLSMVYGFVKQSGGHVEIDSEEGRGTSIKLYLPRATTELDTAARSLVQLAPEPIVGGHETVLVVEDDQEVRTATAEMLRELGYQVLPASNGDEAWAILQKHASIDLLFTDVVMPGQLHSSELARRAQALLPNLAVLYASGYAKDVIVHEGRLDPGVSLLSKPYGREDLARRLRQILRAPRTESTPVEQTTRGLHVVLVEDDEDQRVMAAEYLRARGHHITEHTSAESALAHLAAHTVDVLFTDYTLPGLDGLELARRARALQPKLRVFVASGYSLDAEVASLGPDAAALSKPYNIAIVSRLFKECAASLPP